MTITASGDTLRRAEELLGRDIRPYRNNQHGKLTVFAWLRHIAFHANLESKRSR